MSFSQIKLESLSQEEVNKILGDAWLNFYVDESKLYNPLLNFPPNLADDPHLYITWLLMQPEYFSFICKEILNIQLFPLQNVILQNLWNHRFPMLIGSRGLAKSSSLAIYALLRMILFPGRKIVIAGAAFRQSKIIFEYMENIWNNSPLLRDMCPRNSTQGPIHGTDLWTFRIGDSITKAIPIGTGDRIRGQRSNDTISDEFSAIPKEIFETVIGGFAAVSANPIENMRREAKIKLAKILKIKLLEDIEDGDAKDNQLILSGTAYYDFNHFADYWKKWKKIIATGGDKNELEALTGSRDFNWKDYCIMRIPFELIPDGFMDKAQVERSRASIHSGVYANEYGAVFSSDSNGFFKRSLIESCVAKPGNNIFLPDGSKIVFGPIIHGNPKSKYIYAIDPASEVDNFAIVILEILPTHRRIVYCWTTDKKDYKQRIKFKLSNAGDFYSFCIRKIRALMKTFPCFGIAIDSQGGGHNVISGLQNHELLNEGEVPLLPIIEHDNPKDTDGMYGEHIIHEINFADADWTSRANQGLRFNLESKSTLFPYVDALDVALQIGTNEGGNLYDTLEDCIFEIEELKNEMATIIMTQTPSGRDKWDTPEVKLPGAKKGRMRKDRYSALVMANSIANLIQNKPIKPVYNVEIGWAERGSGGGEKGPLYSGPGWAVDALKDLYS